MFGQNPIRKQELYQDGNLWVQGIFSTIQGEGSHAGTPSVFIRLAGCNLTCEFCDTQFESAFESEKNFQSVEQVLIRVDELTTRHPGCNNVVITGGEPFRQNFVPLASALLAVGYTIEIETAGTLWIDSFSRIAKDCHVTVSPKTLKIKSDIEKVASAYKYVVGVDNYPKGDVVQDSKLWIPLTMTGKPLPKPKYHQPIFIQPMDDSNKGIVKDNIAIAIELVKQTGWRLSIQTHKYIGVK